MLIFLISVLLIDAKIRPAVYELAVIEAYSISSERVNKAVEKILPASITGPVAMIIGLTLAANALSDAYAPSATYTGDMGLVWVVSLATLLSTVLFARYLKGFLAQLPLLLGAIVGCLTAAII